MLMTHYLLQRKELILLIHKSPLIYCLSLTLTF